MYFCTKNRWFYITGCIIVIASLFACSDKTEAEKKRKERDKWLLHEIKERGYITAVTDYSSTNYFLYKGQPMGFQYELLTQYAKHLGVKLEILVTNDLDTKFGKLIDRECDLIAINMTVTKERSKIVDFTVPYTLSRQVLVQRKPEGWENMSRKRTEDSLVRTQLDLAGKTIYIQNNSCFRPRLESLMEEIGDTIYIIDTTEFVAEQLISMVAKGRIDYTVADEVVALVNATYYPDIDVGTEISFPQKLAWAVRHGTDSLLADINSWMSAFKETRKYLTIYNKYFRNSKSAHIVKSKYYSLNEGRISPFDDLFKKYSKEIDWDWRLLASLVYQESHFQNDAVSWAGAYGLMQLMPTTAERFGVDSTSSAEENLKAGVRFIAWLDDKMKTRVENKDERIKFVLAAYNVGLGHILDARNLADKYNKDSNIWEQSVDFFVLNKSRPKYYRDPVVKHGYCRGEEPYRYVYEIIERYEHYRNMIPE
ncbi:MAG: transporter substrate-binding domain-containing protein [Bacteroidetes bacterium]|nr:transporter substrate-binding domain-containing protein [Bacteroidota bacterium]